MTESLTRGHVGQMPHEAIATIITSKLVYAEQNGYAAARKVLAAEYRWRDNPEENSARKRTVIWLGR